MAIEFRCGQCGRLLRTGDDTVGRSAQCPQCGALTTVPSGAGPAPPSLAPGEARPALGGAGQPAVSLGGGSAPGGLPPDLGVDLNNPYQAPSQYGMSAYAPPAADAATRVLGPAIGLIVTAIINMVVMAGYFVLTLVALSVDPPPGMHGRDPAFMFGVALGCALLLLPMIVYALVLFGALRMKGLRSYSLAMAGSILALLPCSFCCWAGLPFGIWAIVTLNDPAVRAAFQR